MSGALQLHDDDTARCIVCGALAVGPCATCHRPVCGDCCVLTEGGVATWAICLRCDRTRGRSLREGWRGVAVFFGVVFALLAAVAIVTVIVSRGR